MLFVMDATSFCLDAWNFHHIQAFLKLINNDLQKKVKLQALSMSSISKKKYGLKTLHVLQHLLVLLQGYQHYSVSAKFLVLPFTHVTKQNYKILLFNK